MKQLLLLFTLLCVSIHASDVGKAYLRALEQYKQSPNQQNFQKLKSAYETLFKQKNGVYYSGKIERDFADKDLVRVLGEHGRDVLMQIKGTAPVYGPELTAEALARVLNKIEELK